MLLGLALEQENERALEAQNGCVPLDYTGGATTKANQRLRVAQKTLGR